MHAIAALDPSVDNARGAELLVDVAACLRVEVPGFGHHLLGDPFTQLPAGELAVGVR